MQIVPKDLIEIDRQSAAHNHTSDQPCPACELLKDRQIAELLDWDAGRDSTISRTGIANTFTVIGGHEFGLIVSSHTDVDR